MSLTVDSRNAGGSIKTYEDLVLKDGASAYDALKAKYSDVVITNTFGSIYVSSIDGYMERDHGSGSGWVYKVNDQMSDKSCNKSILKNGDKVKWIYTIDMGATEGQG